MSSDEKRCPHMKIVSTKGIFSRKEWYCKWCGQNFVPATRIHAEEVIKREIEWEEFNKRTEDIGEQK